jgi:type II secretion system protein H
MKFVSDKRYEACNTKRDRAKVGGSCHSSPVTCHAAGFTLIELILVLALLVVITSIAAPAMSRFVRGRALDSEARRLSSLMHAAQARAVSEGMPMMLWVDEKAGNYGMAAETSGQNGDPKAEQVALDSTLVIAVVNTSTGVQTTFNNLPAIRFLADGTVDESSPQTLKLTDSDGFSRWLTETRLRNGYEVNDTGP